MSEFQLYQPHTFIYAMYLLREVHKSQYSLLQALELSSSNETGVKLSPLENVYFKGED